jgi:hypothetical protein
MKTLESIHFIADLKDCQCDLECLKNKEFAELYFSSLVNDDICFKMLKPIVTIFGEEGFLLINICNTFFVNLRTWPNKLLVQVDIYIPEAQVKSIETIQKLYNSIVNVFLPKTIKVQTLYR